MAGRKVVYNSIATAINTYDATAYVTQRYEPIPKAIPCVLCQQIGKVRTQQYATLCNTDEQSLDTYEVQVWAYGLENAYKLMEVAEAKFKQLGFFELLCTPVNNGDKSFDRVVARFSAQQGAN